MKQKSEARLAKLHLENFVEIILGRLYSTPSISFLNNISLKVENIKNGDIFIARNKDDIQQAIMRGAYAIVSDEVVEISDDEIAWIVVDNIDNAIIRFIKYIKIINNIEIYHFDEVSFALANKIIKDKEIRFASSLDELLDSIFHKIVIINFEVLLFEINHLERDSELLFKILKQTLFECKLEYQNQVYSLTIPSIFIRNLNDVMYFCASLHIEFNLKISEGLFLPIFINSFAQSVKYGQSMRFIYASKNKNLIDKFIEFVLSASWGKTLVLSNVNITNENINKKFEIKKYKNKNDLMKYFLLEQFHFFIVYGIQSNEILSILKDEIIEPNLF
ncbi:MAG: hypothetical protein K2P17_05835 [Helicobacteraceae bacterium]|nr:hypothetical protein [Helicobacteraceae bacterium]